MQYKGFAALSFMCAAATILGAAEPTLLEQGYSQMYNLQFGDAHRSFEEWKRLHPEDPMGPVSNAVAYLFSEFDRLHILQSEFFTHDKHFATDHKLTPDPQLKQNFENELAQAGKLVGRAPAGDKNAMFASILATGLHGDYLALIEKRYGPALKEMKAGREQAERLLAEDPACYDAWVAIGVENYMLGTKPVVTRWFLRATGAQVDRNKGIEKLTLAAEKGHYLAPFARLLLAVAALRDDNTQRARELLDSLCKQFPHNHLYARELAQLVPASGESGSR